MNAEQLKNSILQRAIEGKLVEQREEEGTAAELLREIKAEKARLVKEGKLKKEKTLPEIKAEEIPFEIPESWEWVRIGDIIQIINGDRGKNYPAKNQLSHTGNIPFISAVNIDNGTISEDNLLYVSEERYQLLRSGHLHYGDLILCIRGSLGKNGRYPFQKGAIASSLVILRSYIEEELLYVYLGVYLNTGLFVSEIRRYDNGTAQPNLGARDLAKFLVPLPPLAEQKRIVAKIEELLPHVVQYGKTHDELTALNEKFPDAMKKSVLQYAMEGKLVEQREEEGTAKELLAAIKAEKARLVKEGKLKKEKPLPEIKAEEIPFEIPESWEWVRLGEIFNIVNGFTPLKSNSDFWVNGDIPWFTIEDVHKQGRFIYNTQKFITQKALSKNTERIIPPNTVLLCCTASIGEYAYTKIALTTNQQFNALVIKKPFSTLIYPLYVYEFVQTLKTSIANKAGKTTFNFLSVSKLANFLIPLPPLAEQKRIVAKIEELLACCGALGES